MNDSSGYHHGHLRQALIDQALKAIEESGLDGLSLRAIAESIGVSKAAPYRHFKTKRDLLVALAAEGYAKFADLLEENEAHLTESVRRGEIHPVFELHGEFVLSQPQLYRLMFSSLGNSLHSERCKINSERAFSVLVRVGTIYSESEKDIKTTVLNLYARLHGWALLLIDDLIPPQIGINRDNWLDFIQ